MERPFPRHTGRRANVVLAALCALVALVAAIAIPTASADDLKHKHAQVRRHISGAQADLDEASHSLASALGRLSSARSQLADARAVWARARAQWKAARAVDAKVRAQLIAARAELDQAQADVAQGKLDVRNQRDDIGRLAATNYEYGDPKLMRLVVLMNSQTPGDMTTQLNVADNIMNRESTTLGTLQAARDRLIVAEGRAERAEARVVERRRASIAHLVQTRNARIAARDARDHVARLVVSRQRIAAQAARIRHHDLAKLQRLKAEERRIKHQILLRAMHQRGGYRGNTGGFLYRPVPGYVTSPYGWRRHPIYGYWGLHDGTDFHAPCGVPLHAAGSGRVVDEYYSDVWGNRLFLDLGRVNGKNWTVIYNHISRYRVGQGARVGRGDVVAYAGTTGWSTACHLHFTVLINGDPVDPMKFM